MLKRLGLGRGILIFAGVLVLLLAAGLLWDEPISDFLYTGRPSLFTSLFEAIGKLPQYLTLGVAGVLLAGLGDKEKPVQRLLCLALGAALVIASFTVGLTNFLDDAKALPVTACVAIMGALFLAVCIGMVLLTRNASREDVLRFVLTSVLICAGMLAITTVLKLVWGRPRMQFLRSDARAVFAPLWKPDRSQKEAFLLLDVDEGCFRSFPSGHAAGMACTMLLPLLATLNRRLEGRGPLLLILSAVLTAVTCFSRLVAGAHFLTDVTVPCILVLLLLFLSLALFYHDTWLFRKLSKLFL